MPTSNYRDPADSAGLDDVDPALTTARDAGHLRAIITAAEAAASADAMLRQSVQDARAAGHSWSVIGVALGVTRQAAQQRFGNPSTERREPIDLAAFRADLDAVIDPTL